MPSITKQVTLATICASLFAAVQAVNTVVVPNQMIAFGTQNQIRGLGSSLKTFWHHKKFGGEPVKQEVVYAWDLTNNCYLESTSIDGLSITTSVCNGKSVTFNEKTKACTTANNATDFTTVIPALFASTFTTAIGTVRDPFNSTSGDTFYLWTNAAKKNWMWVRTSDNALVYRQDFIPATKNFQVTNFPQGIVQNAGLSIYDFTIFECAA